MFTGIKIYCPQDITLRSYVYTRVNGKKIKYYNGKQFGIHCFPNECTDLRDRRRELKRLAAEVNKKFATGWEPLKSKTATTQSAEDALKFAKIEIVRSKYSSDYTRDLTVTTTQFLTYLKENNLPNINIRELKGEQIECFLQKFTSSGTYYMNKRRFLSAVFTKLKRNGIILENPIKNTTKRKVKAKLHEAFKESQLLKVLDFIQKENTNLYLCALLMYGSALRPHKEIRLLTRKCFAEDLSYIMIDGFRNKNGKIRKTPTTDYVREVLKKNCIMNLKPDENIFTRTEKPFNKYYFSLAWARAKSKMIEKGLVSENQTLYSFRHSAAVSVFTKHQNLSMLQKMFAHSSLMVSITYLRSLGQVDMIDEKFMPEL